MFDECSGPSDDDYFELEKISIETFKEDVLATVGTFIINMKNLEDYKDKKLTIVEWMDLYKLWLKD